MVVIDPTYLEPHEAQFARHIGLALAENGCPVKKQPSDHLRVEWDGKTATVYYGKPCELFRGLALLKEDWQAGEVRDQPARLSSLSVFCDCSRNAVMHPAMVRSMIMDVAALGFDQMQLYTEDTFEIPEYPYFGHLRGRYTQEEIRQLDAFAAQFGIELVPAVQTLAHLNAIFQWPCFEPIHDTGDILLCGEEQTYAFLDRMIASLRAMYRTDKINIGMDEAHMMGLGNYLMKNGYHSRMDIFLKHINRLMEILRKYRFRPMMWSDMFFKIASGRCTYSNLEAIEFDPDMLALIPPELSLVYWNYSVTDTANYDRLFAAHRKMGREVLFAGGFRKWIGFCPALHAAFRSSRAALESVCRSGVQKVIVTGWGDNGAEGAMYLMLPGLALYAQKCYTDDMSDAAVDHRLQTLFGYSLAEFSLLEQPNFLPGDPDDTANVSSNRNKALLFNDPLLGLCDRHIPAGTDRWYEKLTRQLEQPMQKDNRFGYLFETVHYLCRTLAVKAEIGNRLRAAYRAGDRTELEKLTETLEEAVRRLDKFQNVFRRNWQRENKIFGFDVQDIRFGALRARLVYAAQAVHRYAAGETDRIEELEQPSLYRDCREETSAEPLRLPTMNWNQMVTPSVL